MSPYNYNTSNELTSTPSGNYTYDSNGNEKSKPDGTTYFWDSENRLTQVILPGSGGTVNFKYDPFGRRVQKAFTQNGTAVATNYLYDGANILETTDQSANVLARYTDSLTIDEPLSELVSGTTSYYGQDGLYSVTSLSNSAGALVNTYAYDSYGKLTASTGTLANPFQYTGREFDAETGSYYYRARYFDQNVGRFASEDPIRFYGGVNFYAYVRNRPATFLDPMGLDPNGPNTASWWTNFKNWWNNFWTPKPNFGYKPALYNQCDAGWNMLFTEGSPINPYYGKDTNGRSNTDVDAAVSAWREGFNHKCEAQEKPGMSTVPFCGASVLGPNGPILVCSCCQKCDTKGK